MHGQSVWSTELFAQTRTPRSQFVPAACRQSHHCPPVITAASACRLIITEIIISNLVRFTDLEGQWVKGEEWQYTDDIEMEAFLSCLINPGAMSQGLLSATLIWQRCQPHKTIFCIFYHKNLYFGGKICTPFPAVPK